MARFLKKRGSALVAVVETAAEVVVEVVKTAVDVAEDLALVAALDYHRLYVIVLISAIDDTLACRYWSARPLRPDWQQVHPLGPLRRRASYVCEYGADFLTSSEC
jgi:hypothetical protein